MREALSISAPSIAQALAVAHVEPDTYRFQNSWLVDVDDRIKQFIHGDQHIIAKRSTPSKAEQEVNNAESARALLAGIRVGERAVTSVVPKCYGDAFAYRALDQIHAAATGGSSIMIVGENAGLFQGQNGRTHQSVSQPNALMGIPELKFYEPADAVDLQNVFSQLLMQNEGVSYVRFHRGTVSIERDPADIDNTDAYFIHRPDKTPDLVLMSSGFTAENSVAAARNLESKHGLPTAVVNVVNQKTLPGSILGLVSNNAPIVTVYNGAPNILAASVAAAILGNPDAPRPRFIVGHGYASGTTGKVGDVIRHFGLDSAGVEAFALRKLQNT